MALSVHAHTIVCTPSHTILLSAVDTPEANLAGAHTRSTPAVTTAFRAIAWAPQSVTRVSCVLGAAHTLATHTGTPTGTTTVAGARQEICLLLLGAVRAIGGGVQTVEPLPSLLAHAARIFGAGAVGTARCCTPLLDMAGLSNPPSLATARAVHTAAVGAVPRASSERAIHTRVPRQAGTRILLSAALSHS